MFYCSICGSADCCERFDLIDVRILCDDCYKKIIYSECNCDACRNGFYEGDKLRCKLDVCKPLYDI